MSYDPYSSIIALIREQSSRAGGSAFFLAELKMQGQSLKFYIDEAELDSVYLTISPPTEDDVGKLYLCTMMSEGVLIMGTVNTM